jgi:hypothetical protein
MESKKLDVWNTWSVSFHGVKSVAVLEGIFDHGGLMKPGDTLLDGTRLKSTKCAGRQDKVFHTSPTIKYAGLRFYAEPQRWGEGGLMRASIAMQCRQKPGTFASQGETMDFTRKMPGHLARNCPHVDLGSIEWTSKQKEGTIPYGVLVRTWAAGKDPSYDAYSSPLDGPSAGDGKI